jgi:hypothetical protein
MSADFLRCAFDGRLSLAGDRQVHADRRHERAGRTRARRTLNRCPACAGCRHSRPLKRSHGCRQRHASELNTSPSSPASLAPMTSTPDGRLFRALTETAVALGNAHRGGMDRLQHRR